MTTKEVEYLRKKHACALSTPLITGKEAAMRRGWRKKSPYRPCAKEAPPSNTPKFSIRRYLLRFAISLRFYRTSERFFTWSFWEISQIHLERFQRTATMSRFTSFFDLRSLLRFFPSFESSLLESLVWISEFTSKIGSRYSNEHDDIPRIFPLHFADSLRFQSLLVKPQKPHRICQTLFES